jgi:hypothetical protein
MGRLRVLLASAALLVPMLLVFSGPVLASCAQANLTVWEDYGYNGDGLVICSPVNLPNLGNVVHTQPGICNGGVGFDDWDNCISAAQFFEFGGFNTSACLFTEVNFLGFIWKGVNNGNQEHWLLGPPFGLNDTATSTRFVC